MQSQSLAQQKASWPEEARLSHYVVPFFRPKTCMHPKSCTRISKRSDKKIKKKESHPKVSRWRSLSCSLRGHLVLSTTSRGSPRPAGSGFSTVGVTWCGSSGSPSWSGMGATGVSGPAYSSRTQSSPSKEDCSWILSSGTHREEGRDGWRPGEGGGSPSG